MGVENDKVNTIKQKTILVAEDNESNYLLVVAILKKDYTLIHAYDGLEVIQYFKEFSPDAILMDIKMPRMDGLSATRKIRELNPNIPIIAISAFAFDSDKREAAKAGCSGYITKPLNSSLLKATLRHLLPC